MSWLCVSPLVAARADVSSSVAAPVALIAEGMARYGMPLAPTSMASSRDRHSHPSSSCLEGKPERKSFREREYRYLTLGTAIPRDKARDGPAVASPFLGVRALGSDAAGTCKPPSGTDGRETVNGTSRVSYQVTLSPHNTQCRRTQVLYVGTKVGELWGLEHSSAPPVSCTPRPIWVLWGDVG